MLIAIEKYGSAPALAMRNADLCAWLRLLFIIIIDYHEFAFAFLAYKTALR
jgi:hypothetical protein